MKLAMMIEGMFGLTWPRWHRLVVEIEQLGFAGLFRSDHFTLMEPPDADALEAIVSLTYVAVQTRRMHFGTLVAPLSFRDPIMLARQAMALDDLSDGRMVLGVGAGWMEREHAMFGYDLGDVATRMARLEEGLEVVTRLIRSEAPVTFAGRFHRLEEAQLLPRPKRPTRILLGGNGPNRTLPLVARYADVWNGVGLSPEQFAERSARLDELLRGAGRPPQDVQRTLMAQVVCWRDEREFAARMEHLRRAYPSFGALTAEAVGEQLRGSEGAVVGTPEEVVAGLQAYAAAGVEELMMQWISLDDIEGITRLAEDVLPHV
jgi:alkanesulfonate monooxygenase SsuD/methylene tetrahydromethanopterin reductase-like flavin-dependent oxidoreductase (luciferase family)